MGGVWEQVRKIFNQQHWLHTFKTPQCPVPTWTARTELNSRNSSPQLLDFVYSGFDYLPHSTISFAVERVYSQCFLAVFNGLLMFTQFTVGSSPENKTSKHALMYCLSAAPVKLITLYIILILNIFYGRCVMQWNKTVCARIIHWQGRKPERLQILK